MLIIMQIFKQLLISNNGEDSYILTLPLLVSNNNPLFFLITYIASSNKLYFASFNLEKCQAIRV
jgi:hypothetical protein